MLCKFTRLSKRKVENPLQQCYSYILLQNDVVLCVILKSLPLVLLCDRGRSFNGFSIMPLYIRQAVCTDQCFGDCSEGKLSWEGGAGGVFLGERGSWQRVITYASARHPCLSPCLGSFFRSQNICVVVLAISQGMVTVAVMVRTAFFVSRSLMICRPEKLLDFRLYVLAFPFLFFFFLMNTAALFFPPLASCFFFS